jgi:hypothetical protein
VDALDLLDAFQLRDQRLCHEDVDTAATVQPDSLVFDMQWVPEARRDAVRFPSVANK